jgi:hypothetical protein
MNIIRFQEIDQFRHAIRNVQSKAQFVGLDAQGEPIMNRLAIMPKLKYEGTPKIHGCCSSVQIRRDGSNIPQSRNQELSIEKDNYGFAKFILSLPPEVWVWIKFNFGDNIVVHGEWAGKGIQDTVAVSQLDRFWTIFRIEKLDQDENGEDTGGDWIRFNEISFISLNQYRVYSIYQFGVVDLTIDFEHPANDTNKINETSLAVEAECPVAKFFGISGIGEGRVWVCVEDGYQSSKYVFKVKGSKHSKSKVNKLANVDVEKMANIEAFVAKHANEERLTQGFNWLKENGLAQDETKTGDFIRWVFNDIIKEEADELTANGLTVKELGGAVNKAARLWYFAKIQI